ncbi:putative hypoxanthine-guanine-xanthine phosphoribosyltransferase [Sesbania bispinosa]|nr:putative hypoxanthine-guanine-xanthine phosphoribosyltransferase [Sesbania bispinosa]
MATGAFLFLADLVCRIDLPITIDLVRAESFGSGAVCNGAPTISIDLEGEISTSGSTSETRC